MAQPPKAARPEHGRKAPNAIAMDEVDLVSLVAMEDVRAFEALYRAYHPRLRRFLRGMLRQATMVDEVLDDTMLVAWR